MASPIQFGEMIRIRSGFLSIDRLFHFLRMLPTAYSPLRTIPCVIPARKYGFGVLRHVFRQLHEKQVLHRQLFSKRHEHFQIVVPVH